MVLACDPTMNDLEKKILIEMQGFVEKLEAGEDPAEFFTCRTVTLDLRPSKYGPKKIVETREMLQVSQPLFARFLGVSPATVRAWEQGVNKPSAMACRFMDEVRADITRCAARLKEHVHAKGSRPMKKDVKKLGALASKKAATKR